MQNMIHLNQQAYYDAIAESSSKGQSGPFIEFMLAEILETLKAHRGNDISGNVGINVGINDAEQRILTLIAQDSNLTIKKAAQIVSLSQRQVERLFASLKDKGFITRLGGNKTGRWIINK